MKVTSGILAALAVVALGACSNVDFKKTKGGLPYKVFSGKGSKDVDSGNIVKIQVVQKIGDSVLYSSWKTGMPVYIPVNGEGHPYDFTEVLPSLKQGDSLYTVQLMDTFMARSPQMVPPQFKKGDKLETGIRILDVFKTPAEAQKDEAKERMQAFDRDTAVQNQLQKDAVVLNNYLQSNNINAEKTGKGTYVQILTPGTGAQITDGQYVSVKYKGTTLQGTVFDTNMDSSKGHTAPMVFQAGAPGMIRGFDEGVHLLREGSKAKLFIPSMLAYGPQPPSPDLQPYDNLIFDIEVLKVSDQPIQQPMPQMPRRMPDTSARR